MKRVTIVNKKYQKDNPTNNTNDGVLTWDLVQSYK